MLLFFGQAQAQLQGVCGMTTQDQVEARKKFLQEAAELGETAITPRGAITYVPITFHLVANSSRQGRITENNVLDMLCEMNKDFLDAEIQFYIKKFTYINNDAVYEHEAFQVHPVMTAIRDNSSVNVFIVQKILQNNETSGVLGYWNRTPDWVVLDDSEINARSASTSHEVGHFFGLSHTHLGWDSEQWEESVHGNPAPALSPSGIPTELMDGSNCATAGDGLCDTPPDYNFGLGWPNCNYTGGAKDPAGVIVDPMETNIMGYFLSCSRSEYVFTPMQQQHMRTNLFTPSRSYVRSNTQPSTLPINQAVILRSPIGNEMTNSGQTVVLDWDDVPNATQYFLEISRINTFSVQPIRLVVSQSTATIEGLDLNKKYFWRVRPFSNYYTCTSFSPTESFTTSISTSVEQPQAVSAWSVQPNPVRAGQSLLFSLTTSEPIQGDLRLFSITGQLVKTMPNQRFALGETTLEIPTTDFAPGVYLVSFVTGDGILTEKVVVRE